MQGNVRSERRYLSVKDAARRLEVHPSFIYRIIKNNPDGSPFQRFGRVLRVRIDLFEKWASQKVIK
ncbi:MAG: hypothetical protein C5B50_00640 [Verrucomicrobia bacterium]|nr:MAG: hypothetical protein C5B50_00640 [Verrucomicrobiota bacterium]